MKIAIDIRILAEKRAGKASQLINTLKGLVKNSASHSYVLYTQKAPKDVMLDERFQIKAKNIPMPLWHVWCWFDFTYIEKVDVFYASLSYIIPAFSKKCVVLVHDMVSFLGISQHNKKAQFIEKLTLKRALKNALGIIAVSENTAKDIIKIFNIQSETISVVHEGIDEYFYDDLPKVEKSSILKKYSIDSGYIFFLSTLEPRKNILGILASYEKLTETHPNAPHLVMAGGRGWNYEQFDEAYQRSPVKDSVKLLGHVSSEDLPGLYQNASLYFFPVKYEGFGLTVLEAMASNVPVITSRVSSLPEIGGDAVEYVNPESVDDMTQALVSFFEGGYDVDMMKGAAYDRASTFSIVKMANETLSVIEKRYANIKKN